MENPKPRLSAVPATPAPPHPGRVEAVPFERDWIDAIQVNAGAVERRIASLSGRRTVKKQWQAAWLLKAVTLMDLTTLAGDDTEDRVRRLCAKARQPVRADLLEAMGAENLPIQAGAVCVYHDMVPAAVKALEGSGIPVAAVSTGFPAGLSPFSVRLAEIRESVAAGAQEIDIVISRRAALASDWARLYDETRAMREACGTAHMKAILAAGELGSLRKIAQASMACMMAGADFIKTSTGMEGVNATPAFALVMMRMIREFQARTGQRVGFKPAGGIAKAKDALGYLTIVKEELGDPWLDPALFRFGASRLLTDIERQLEHFVTGRYSAAHRHPLG